ncbi:MAG: hypothetical protein LBU53_11405 [Zoogloeaceae bacterium]|jgi:hypothetical protein|nr:hypothetical protein [Zoogloeaceae bacterium]
MKSSKSMLRLFAPLALFLAFSVHAAGIDTARDVSVNGLAIARDAKFTTFTLAQWRKAVTTAKPVKESFKEYEECGPGILGYFLEIDVPEMKGWLRADFERNPASDLRALVKKGDDGTQRMNLWLMWSVWDFTHSNDVLTVDGKKIHAQMKLAEFQKMFPRSVQHGNELDKPRPEQQLFVVLLDSGGYDPEDPEHEGIWNYQAHLAFDFQNGELVAVSLASGNPCG